MTSYGRPGGTLENAAFAASAGAALAGRAGEVLTAKILDAAATAGGFTVLHDLRIPGAKANIDHIVVSGRRVWVIDSKMWQPGIYWTLRGRTRRGLHLAAHADKRGLPFGADRIAAHLAGTGVRMKRPLMVIHSSRQSAPVRIGAYRPASGATGTTRALHPRQLRFPAMQADPLIVAQLVPLVN